MWPLLLLPACLALHMQEPRLPAPPARNNDVIEDYVTVRLNHFDASNTDTFNMRYFYNPSHVSSPDIVIFVGGEWEISAGWVQAGLAYELAQQLGAGLFYTEHRYYGQTRPNNDTAVSNLRFLTVDQALADLAQFIQHVKSDRFQHSSTPGYFRTGKVILVGCSYSGSMATWMRLAYPHLVNAAFSDSGPLHAQEDFPEYLEKVTEALRVHGGETCVTSVQQGVASLESMLNTNPTAVSTMFNTCSEIQAGSPLDRATFYWFGITETFAYLVQTAVPGDVQEACRVLTDASVAEPVQRLANFITSHPWTQPCIETRYSEVVAQHSDTDYNAEHTVMRLWTYQTCVEFGWYQTTSGTNHPFLGGNVPLEYFHRMCQDFFSSYFDESVLRSGIERTNLFFAGWDFIPDYVVSVAGGLDPWSPMGPNATHSHALAPVYVVPEVSHCRAIMPTTNPDTEALSTTQQAVLTHLYEWTRGPALDSSPAATAATSIALLVLSFMVTL